MSTDSTTLFSIEDDGRVSETPIPSQQKCTRGSLCSQSDCLVCNGPIPNHHVRDLTKDLETTPTPNKYSKPPAPPEHFISTFTEEFQQVLLADNMEDIKIVLQVYDLQITTCTDILKFDRTNSHVRSMVASRSSTKQSRCSSHTFPSSPPGWRLRTSSAPGSRS